jgi:hypothetical protein
MERVYYENEIRPLVKPGDILLFRGHHLLARTIQYFDSAYYNHVGVVFEAHGRLFIIDSNARGVHPELLSDRCLGYDDVGIIRPLAAASEKRAALDKVMAAADDGIKYDFTLLPRIAIARTLRRDVAKGMGSERRDICSEFAARYAHELCGTCYNTGGWITPQDFVRLMDKTHFTPIRIK